MAPEYDNPPTNGADNRGHVRIYEWNSGTLSWDLIGDIEGESSGDKSGTSISLSSDGNRLAIGAPRASGFIGRTRVYEYGVVQVGHKLDKILMGRLILKMEVQYL